MANYSDFAIKWELLVSDCWGCDDLKSRLLADPQGVMKERGIEIPDGVEVQIHENTETSKHFVIPCAPCEEELSEEQLEAVAGGHSRLSGHLSGHHSGGHSSHSSHSSHSGHSGGHFC